ncbi:MAG: flagellar hook protein FlgE [Qingshengfaniella sp.]
MTISSSLNAGVMGLQVQASRLGTISDNIANSSTFGYRRAEADFHSMVNPNSSGAYAAGGVRVTTQRLISEGGSLVTTNNATDIAVRGRGMIPVTTSAAVKTGSTDLPFMLATTGSFRPDESGYLKSPAGLVLMGWKANTDGSIPPNSRDTDSGLVPVQVVTSQLSGEPTTRMTMGVNLPATSTESTSLGSSETLQVEYFDSLGKAQSLSMEFVPTVPATGASNEWTMIINDNAQAGLEVGRYTMAFNDSWTSGGTLASVTPITGGAYDPLTGAINVNVPGGAMEITIGMLGEPGGMSQLSDTYAPIPVIKNGSEVSTVVGVEIDENGFVNALYDSGISRTLYQVPLADVANQNGLRTLDNQTYQITKESGNFFLWDAGSGPTGSVVGYSREESATDVAGELTGLIQTQRAYASNAKVIQTVDEMLQETTNIKR